MTSKLKSNPRCIICGNIRQEGMRDCGNHKDLSYDNYKKIKSKVWNDTWFYFPIQFGGGLFLLTSLITLFSITNPLIIIPSFGIPTVITCLIHDVRQKRKNLPFWGLTDDQEVERLMTQRGKGN